MDEIFKNNVYRILEIFIEHPATDFSIRGLGRSLKLSHATVIKYIDDLLKIELIRKKEQTLYPTYYANTESQKYRQYKRDSIAHRIKDSGLLEDIQKKALPSSIILFGSCAKGDFTEKSDIDIFVESKEHSLDMGRFEKGLNRKINLLFEPNISGLSRELRNNILNGIILYGYVKAG